MMSSLLSDVQKSSDPPAFQWKLWIYTNYDCNLRCSYCVAKSGPNAPRRALSLSIVKLLIDEAVALGFNDVFFTGGEPFILNDIYEMLAYSSTRVKTTVLTNSMLLRGARLDRLCAIANDQLIVQVSLDGALAEDHDAYPARAAGPRPSKASGFCRSAASVSVCLPPRRLPTRRGSSRFASFIGPWAFPTRIIFCARSPNAATRKRASNWI
jgi:hypothetical protein